MWEIASWNFEEHQETKKTIPPDTLLTPTEIGIIVDCTAQTVAAILRKMPRKYYRDSTYGSSRKISFISKEWVSEFLRQTKMYQQKPEKISNRSEMHTIDWWLSRTLFFESLKISSPTAAHNRAWSLLTEKHVNLFRVTMKYAVLSFTVKQEHYDEVKRLFLVYIDGIERTIDANIQEQQVRRNKK